MVHGIGETEPEFDWSPFDYLIYEPVIKEINENAVFSKEQMTIEFENVGFRKGDNFDWTLGQLSGGWKIRMGLARAMLIEADILLMDEPTGHSGRFDYAGLLEYAKSLKTGAKPVTVITFARRQLLQIHYNTHLRI